MRHLAIFFLAASMSFAAFRDAAAQRYSDPLRAADQAQQGIIDQFDVSPGISLETATVQSEIAPATADRPAVLLIHVEIAPGKHAYSLTQPRGGPLPSRIELEHSRDFRLLGSFRPFPAAHSRIEQGKIWNGLEMQEHEGEFTWFAPIEITAGGDLAALGIRGVVHMEVCQTGGYCEAVEKQFSAKISDDALIVPEIQDQIAGAQRPAPSPDWSPGSIQLDSSAVKFTGELVPATVRPGDTAELKFTATLPPGSRIYALADRDERPGTKPTLIAVAGSSGLVPHRPATDAATKTDDSVPQFGPMRYHEGAVTWNLRVDVPKNAPPGDYLIDGLLGYQSCEYKDDGKNICELPHSLRFEATLKVGDTTTKASTPVRFAVARNYTDVARAAADFATSLDARDGKSTPPPQAIAAVEPAPRAAPPASDATTIGALDQYDLSQVKIDDVDRSIGHYIALAFLGGLILNLMPCVLPVIGLKVMSFVEQAGTSRTHALALNVWYAAGIVSVFLLLGILAATIGLTWGGQFGSVPFNVTIAAIVFAMALSLLGVWEVPIPGFFGSSSVHAATSKEGALGAFLKGAVTTVLATPCTAPFMAAAVAWAVTQPIATTLIVFATLGIGMASPYLLIGVYPELLRFLPKPGAWMETFKQISGFVLLATVVFILSFIDPAAIVPTITLLLGIGVACWYIGRTPFTLERADMLRSWAMAGCVVLVFLAVSFGWLYRSVMQPRFANFTAAAGPKNEGPWQAFSLEKLKQVAVDGGKTVLVDFSADWCLNCKVLESAVLHTQPVEKAIHEAGVVTMYADFTKFPPEIKRTIEALRSNGVPVIAVFPGDNPYQPIVFREFYTQQGLIQALEKATGRRLQAATSTAQL